MKGSPIIATALTIVILLGLYIGMRTLILPEAPKSNAGHSHAGHSHAGHAHDTSNHSAGAHDDRALETDFELYFSSIPKTITITQPATNKEILKLTDLDSTEWIGTAVMSLEGHVVELQIDIEWVNASEMNFFQIVANPANHASRTQTLRSDGDISDIAELNW